MRKLRPSQKLLLALSVSALACGDWPEQDQGGGMVEDPNAGRRCVTLPSVRASSSPQVNGALCFGIGIDSGAGLECAQAAEANTTLCADALFGTRYLVRWAGVQGTVYEGTFGNQVGSVLQQNADTFEVKTNLAHGFCTLAPSAEGRTQWCVQP